MTKGQAERFMSPAQKQPVRKRLAEIVGNGTVIDVGCGKADEVEFFDPREYSGIDCSVELIWLAVQNHPKYKFGTINALDLEGTWDFAIIKSVLEHLTTEEALAVYNHVKTCCHLMLVVWHTEPGEEVLKTYDGELGEMMQNRHDVRLFKGVVDREVCDKHVIWTVV